MKMFVRNHVKALRKSFNISLAELSSRSGVNINTLRKIEKSSDYNCSYDVADRIAFALGVPIEVVFPDFKRRSMELIK